MRERLGDIWRSLRRDRGAMLGLILVVLVVLMAVSAPLSPYGPKDRDQRYFKPQAPSGEHLLGTDGSGYDVFSRMLHGARVSLLTGLAAVGIALLLGIPLGAISGYAGGWVDWAAMRFVDVMLAFPSVVLAIALAALFADRSVTTLIVAVGIVLVPQIARQVRGSVLQVKQMEYVTAAQSLGMRPTRVLFRHVLPNCLAPIIVLSTLGVGNAILSAAGLSFLGLGPEARVAEWGVMLKDFNRHIAVKPSPEYWVFVPPGVAIAVTVLGFNLLGDGLRKALDPRAR